MGEYKLANQTLRALFALGLCFTIVILAGCASAPKLEQIPNGETVSIIVAGSPTADGQTELKNDTSVGEDIGKGSMQGAVGGAFLGAFCGFLAPVCIPAFATTGAVVGGGVGAATSTGGNLSNEQATQLRDRILRLNESHDKLAELATNINDRAGRYWDLNSTEPQTTVRVEVQNLIFASTHDNQVRAILQVSVTVKKKSDKPNRLEEVSVVKDYEYASPYASLDLWLDDENDFADASISITIRQISNQIVSDLAGSSNTDGTVQIAKIQPQSISNSASSAFEFYGEAEDEINNNTYNKNVWDKALVETGGDQTKTKARYIELRANQLYSEKVGSISDTSLYQQAAPISMGTQIDLSGTYLSKITGDYRSTSIVQITQDENKITGISGDKSWEIEGVLEGDTVKFVWYGPGNKGKGKFAVDFRGDLSGVFTGDSWGKGKWNLTNVNLNEISYKQIAPLENALTGIYMSKYTGKGMKGKGPDFRKANFEVIIVQDGKKITGTFGKQGKIWGNVVGETIKFEFFATGGYSRKGNWAIDPVNNNLEGTIGLDAAEGWNLTKIQ